jgi:hypothetical protein
MLPWCHCGPARWSFLLFWLAYAAGAMATLLGQGFGGFARMDGIWGSPLRRRRSSSILRSLFGSFRWQLFGIRDVLLKDKGVDAR